MKKFAFAGLVGLLMPAFAAAGGHNDAGCGLGSQLFKEDTKVHQVLAATTNGTFGNQTFGISTGSLGCESKSTAMRSVDQQRFVRSNIRDLSREMATGKGEYLSSLSNLMGCSSAAQFGRFTQARYEAIFPKAETSPSQVLENLQRQIVSDPKMAASCGA